MGDKAQAAVNETRERWRWGPRRMPARTLTKQVYGIG